MVYVRSIISPAAALVLALMAGTAARAQPESPGIATRQSAEFGQFEHPGQFQRDEARWAELEAQKRATDGDYDGAVEAHQQAQQDLQEAERRQSGH